MSTPTHRNAFPTALANGPEKHVHPQPEGGKHTNTLSMSLEGEHARSILRRFLAPRPRARKLTPASNVTTRARETPTRVIIPREQIDDARRFHLSHRFHLSPPARSSRTTPPRSRDSHRPGRSNPRPASRVARRRETGRRTGRRRPRASRRISGVDTPSRAGAMVRRRGAGAAACAGSGVGRRATSRAVWRRRPFNDDAE